jgi:hypothetical protein
MFRESKKPLWEVNFLFLEILTWWNLDHFFQKERRRRFEQKVGIIAFRSYR